MFFSFDDADDNKPAAPIPKSVWQQARSTGELSLAGRRLQSVPDEVYSFNSLKLDEDAKWWEFLHLKKLNISSNKLAGAGFDFWEWVNAQAAKNDTNKKKKNDEEEPRPPTESIEFLDMSSNSITSISERLLSCPELITLNISHNKITKLSKEPLPAPSKLGSLSAGDNALSEIQPTFFDGLSSLGTLQLQSNMLTTIPASISNCSLLRTVNLSSNKLTTLPDVFNKLVSLTDLDVSKNALAELPSSLGEAIALGRLNISNNRLRSLPSLAKLSALKELVANFNNIESLTASNLATSLITLGLGDNSISSIPKETGQLVSLQILDLSNNDLNDIPSELGLLGGLRRLVLEGNPMRGWRRSLVTESTPKVLEYLCGRLPRAPGHASSTAARVDGGAMILSKKNLTKLSAELVSGCSVHGVKILRADKNNISEISEDFFAALDALEVVDLSANKPLITLPDAMRNCSKLRELTLATCGLAGVIPPVVFEFSLLSTLDLSGTALAAIPDSIARLTDLTNLNLANNKLTTIAFIAALSKLTVLNVSGNSIAQLEEGWFANLANLVVLDLSCNDLTDVPSALGYITTLKTLELEGNGIRSIRRAIIEKGTVAILEYLRQR